MWEQRDAAGATVHGVVSDQCAQLGNGAPLGLGSKLYVDHGHRADKPGEHLSSSNSDLVKAFDLDVLTPFGQHKQCAGFKDVTTDVAKTGFLPPPLLSHPRPDLCHPTPPHHSSQHAHHRMVGVSQIALCRMSVCQVGVCQIALC